MNKLFLLALLAVFFASCGGSRSTTSTKDVINIENASNKTTTGKSNRAVRVKKVRDASEATEASTNAAFVDNLINDAKSFEGTRYKFGGTTEKGMDCSGLVYTVFKKQDILMPRISRDMATKGVSVSLKEVISGDLVFFKTSKRNTINHVGLVVENKRGEIFFIHSTTSRGVIISSMEEAYWKKAFVEVRRII
ncbi:MAG: C40 family peptidase [Altibacter sp.]|uniref:C40 family peptidase n=1 Tax=Altibacter sp. TaxID=2024823 RepID=UPI001D55B86C|nr:C40 family peptidase [Altibacter sp.]MBZ0327402.1 C40 family peptidase [Altibacter sp.]